MSADGPTTSNDGASLRSSLDAHLQAAIDAGVPGLSACIATSKGPIWQSVAGFADVETKSKITDNHNFGIGSITKVFISVTTLQLIDEGKLSLSDTVAQHLTPEILAGIPHATKATIAQLLNHTSGVPSWEDDPKWVVEGRGSKLDEKKIWTKTETLDYIRYNSNSDLTAPTPKPNPGTFSYSNTNFTLLGLIIEKVTGKTAESEVRTRILEPLGMKHTYLEGFESPQEGILPQRYHWLTPTFRAEAGLNPAFSIPPSRPDLLNATTSNLSVEWVAGGNVSHPNDLTTFFLSIRNAIVLSPSSLTTMLTFIPTDDPLGSEIGHGIFKVKRKDEEGGVWYGHGGSVLGFTGSVFWNEGMDLAVAVCANVGTMHTGDGCKSAMQVVMNAGFLVNAVALARLEGESEKN